MELRTRAQVTISRPCEQVFDFAVASETQARVLKKLGPIPGIASIEYLGADARLVPGARRRVSMTDGSVLEEEVLEVERPRVHRYRWGRGLRPPFSLLVRTGEGCWTFIDTERGTAVEWLYTFELRSPLAAPLAAGVLLLFRRWMQAGLDRIRAELVSA
jgi:uncharacterized protein YndB with AHSA1/START domain